MGDRDWITRKVDPGVLAHLTEQLPATALWSLLLAVMERRAQRAPADLVRQWREDRFVAPSALDPREMLDVDRELFSAARAFDALELAPLAPLGSCSAVALTSQNRTVASVRGTEVVSDPTNLLALESAARLRTHPDVIVRLACSHRCVRAQPIPKQPGFAAHFRMFCLATAGRQNAEQAFLVDAFREHITVHLDALTRLEALGFRLGVRRVTLLSTPSRAHLARRIEASLPGIPMSHESLQKEYYDGLRFMISLGGSGDDEIPLCDGGAFDWLQKLGGNRKLAFVASGMGSQLIATVFRREVR
jgi:hypothetical protein